MEVIKKALGKFPSKLNNLEEVLSWFNQLNQPFIPIKVWLQCELALAEWFTNVVRHAHQGMPPETPIDIEVTVFDQALAIRVWDQGKGFDIEKYWQNLPEVVDSETEGGRGIPILYQVADQLIYKATDDHRHCLLLIKNYSLSS